MRGILLLVGRLERERAEAEQNKYDPVATLDLLAVRAPLIAAVLAVQYGLPWPARVTRHAAMMELQGFLHLIEERKASSALPTTAAFSREDRRAFASPWARCVGLSSRAAPPGALCTDGLGLFEEAHSGEGLRLPHYLCQCLSSGELFLEAEFRGNVYVSDC